MILILFALVISCKQEPGKVFYEPATKNDSVKTVSAPALSPMEGDTINTGNVTPQEVIGYAVSLMGTPYKYGSINPAEGFDCSGFITHVFNHFNISVPRSSIDFTNKGRAIDITEAKPGDIILFTGTDSTIRHVGHMGIITGVNNNEFEFIHSTSGKANGVTITPLNKYYQGRYVKTIRIFEQNDLAARFSPAR